MAFSDPYQGINCALNQSGRDPEHELYIRRRNSGMPPTRPTQPDLYRAEGQRNRATVVDDPASPVSNEKPREGWHPHKHSGPSWIAIGALTVCAALGLVVVAFADNLSSRGYAYHTTSVFFWFGMLLIFVPIAGRLLTRGADRSEQLVLVIILGIALYIVKILASPDGYTNYDEYIHWRNTANILRTHHLFSYNPILPTAAYYPGLAAITAALVSLTGLSTFASGLIIIGVARLLITACFFLIAEGVTGSSRAASLACLVYISNPMFLFWSSSFSYEDLALPLATFVIWWFSRTRNQPGYLGPIVTVISIGAVIVTHHVVGLLLAALLVTWWLIECFTVRLTRAQYSLGLMALIASSAALLWFFFVARPVAAYLFTDNIVPALNQTGSLVAHQSSTRRLYASGGYVSPEWETLSGFAAVGVLVGALPGGLYLAWHAASLRKRVAHTRRLSPSNAPIIIAVASALAYPLSLLPRLTPGGVALSGRSSEYVFAGLGCVLGLLAEASALRSRCKPSYLKNLLARLCKTPIIMCMIIVVFIGNITVGTAFYQRLPEATNPSGYPWTIQPDVIAASTWALKHLGQGQRIGTDAMSALALATYGEQHTLPEENMWPIFFATTMNATVVRDIKADKVHYVLLDRQMTRGVPPSPGYYFTPQETPSGSETQPFPKAALRKFRSSCDRLVYQSGYVQIFDVSRIENGSCLPQSAGHDEGSS